MVPLLTALMGASLITLLYGGTDQETLRAAYVLMGPLLLGSLVHQNILALTAGSRDLR